MATASRIGQSGSTSRTAGAPPARSPLGRLATWGVPLTCGAVIVGAGLASAAALLPQPVALAAAIIAALVLVLFLAVRPLLDPAATTRDRAVGAALGILWLVACYLPFQVRLFPGTPLLAGAEVRAGGAGLPLVIPAAGKRAIDLLLEGKLVANADGSAAPPVHFLLTVEDAAGAAQVIDGMFRDQIVMQRLGRRGSAAAHRLHTADVRVLANPAGGDLTITQITLQPPTAAPITVTAWAHPLPGTLVLALAAFVLVALVVAFDRVGPGATTDGAFTMATASAIGTAVIFWTGNAAHPDFNTLIGATIFGGPLGFAAGSVVWWIAKRVIAARD
jgi:hypothetical protein